MQPSLPGGPPSAGGRGSGGLQRTTAKRQVEAEGTIERPKMKEKSSFFGSLMKTKIKATTKIKGKKRDKSTPEQPMLRSVFSSTATLPSHPSVLSSYTLDELRMFCVQCHINYEQYEGSTDEKKQLVEALAATYPPDPIRQNYLRMCELEDYLKDFKERVAEYKRLKDQAKLDNIPFAEKAPTHPEEITEEVNRMFSELLKKFEVTKEIKTKLMKSFSIIEKIQHLRNAVCVLDDDQNFMQEDEDMITIMDSDRFIDSIRLLTCKYRIMHSTPEWLSNFCTSGGISVLVENMDNRLDKDPMEITDAASLLQLIYCMKHIMQTDGLHVAIATRGAIDAFCMSLRFEYQTLALEVLEILAVVCTFGDAEGVIQTIMGFHHLARVRNEKPFAVLIDALQIPNPKMQTAVLALVNAMMNVDIELTDRISYRNDLKAVAFNERVNAVSAALNGKDTRAQELMRQESLARLENKGQSIRFQPGLSISHVDVEQSLAEDGVTIIHPEQGVMAGICWEAKKSKSGVKKRWYQVKDGVFSWYHLEERQKDIHCAPNGSQKMASVVEIMGYSTSPDLQRMFKYCFVFQCSDGQRYQFGVQDQITKQRWIVALQTSMSRASQERTAYTIVDVPLTSALIAQAKQEFNKQLEVYHGIESADKELFIAACKDGSIGKSQEISGYLQQEFLARGKEEGRLLENEYLAMLSELLVASNDFPNSVRDMLAEMTSAIRTTTVTTNLTFGDILKKSDHLPVTDTTDLDSLLAENRDLRARLSTPPKRTKSKWKELLGLTKSQRRPSFIFGKSNSKAEETHDAPEDCQLKKMAPTVETSESQPTEESLPARQSPPSTPPPVQKMAPKENVEPEVAELPSPQTEAQIQPPSPPVPSVDETVKPKGKLAASGPLAQMFAGRGAGPMEAPVKSGRGGGAGRGDALAGLFAGRGAGPTSAAEAPSGGRGCGITGRGAGLAGLFAGRGAGPPAGIGGPVKSGGAMKMAVNSSRPIPIPPYLPGQTPQGNGAPLLPGQQSSQPALPSKPKITPNIKMRQLQWLPLKPKEAMNTLWTEIVEPPIEDIVPELETGYGVAVKSATLATSSGATDKKTKPKKESLFDGRRTQNIAITVGKLKMSPDELAALVIELDPERMSADLTLTLLPLCPTPDDIKLIRGYEGKDEDLDVPGRVMSRLVDIPRLEQRLKTHITTLTWEESSLRLESKLDSLGEAVAELRDESCLPSLKEIFSLILAIGNYMNGGTNKGQAHGIRLNGLLKLVECRRNGSKTETLLHQVVKLYRLKHTDDELFYSQWESLWTAKSLSLKQLEVDMKELEVSLSEVQKELAESDKIVEEAMRIPLKRNLSAFLAFAVEKQQKNVETMSEVRKYVTEIRQYFGDTSPDKEEDAGQIFFKTMSEFAVQYMKALKEIDEWAEQERKAKEAAIKAEAEKQRRASLPTMNVGLFKGNHAPTSKKRGGVDAFRLYQEEQALSSEDRISFFKKQMMDRRGALTQTTTTVVVNKGMEMLEETESEDEGSSEDEDWET